MGRAVAPELAAFVDGNDGSPPTTGVGWFVSIDHNIHIQL